jgi:hypothetical protein
MVTSTTRMVTGPCNAKIQLDPTNVTPNAFVELGFSEDGFQVTERPMMNDVFSDRNGGTSGEPVDVQYMGMVATIRGKLTDFDLTQLKRLRQIATKTALVDGQVPEPGCLLVAEGEIFRLLLEGTKDAAAIVAGGTLGDYITPLNFRSVLIRDAIDYNIGSRVAAVELVMTAYTFVDADDSDKRKLWNRDTVA